MNLEKCKASVLTTERLELRAVRADDAGDIIGLANDFEVARRLTRMPHPYREGDAKHFIETILPIEAVWALIRKEDGAFMGVVGLAGKSGENAAEIGYWLGRDYWVRGYMTEAARAVIRFAFEILQFTYLGSGHFADNAASASVLAKLGFVPVGKSRKFCLALNSEVDHVDLRLEAKDFSYKQREDMGKTR